MSQIDKQGMNTTGMPGVRAPPAQMNVNNGPQRRPQGGRPTGEIALDTYIYDYFLKMQMYDCAQALLNARNDLNIRPAEADSPNRRPAKHDLDGNAVNGGDTNMDGSSNTKKEEGEEDLRKTFPRPQIPHEDFLLDWFLLFWDVYTASNSNGKGNATPIASAYVQATQNQKAMQQRQFTQRPMGQPGMMGVPGQMYQHPAMGRGIMIGTDADNKGLLRNAVMNNRNPQQMHPMNRGQPMPNGAREGEGEINGQPRSQSPAAGAPGVNSPGGKRQAIGNGEYRDAQGRIIRMTPGGPGHQGANNTQAILQMNGIDPNQLTQQQFANFQMGNPQAKNRAIAEYAQNIQMSNPMQQQGLQKMMGGQPHMVGQMGGPGMVQPGGEERMPVGDYYGANPHPHMAGNMPGGNNPNGHTHALADYQMQLMVLEQQNKRRLLKARAEQDDLQRGGATGQMGQGAGPMQGMSPQGNRAAPSPGPQGDMKRGTPKMGNAVGPGSPLPDGQMPQQGQVQQRASPAAMQGFNGQGPQGEQNFYGSVNGPGGQMNGAPMRPPSSHPNGQNMQGGMSEQMMNQGFRQQQQQQGGNRPGQWPQQGMPGQQPMGMQQSGPQQPNQPAVAGGARPGQQNMGGAMPPPAQPGANGPRAPASPSMGQQAQPPTPTQSNKAPPKKKAQAPKRPAKKAPTTQPGQGGQTAATPTSGPPTPTPTTPITPSHPSSFATGMNHLNKQGTQFPGQAPGNQNPSTQAPQAPIQQSAGPMPGNNQATSQPENVVQAPFGAMDTDTDMFNAFNEDGGTLLESFDFDSFLHNPDDATNGMPGFDTNFAFPGESVEAGAGES